MKEYDVDAHKTLAFALDPGSPDVYGYTGFMQAFG